MTDILREPRFDIRKDYIGEYNPDWAIVVEPTNQFGDVRNRMYLVTETKGTTQLSELRPSEQRKIVCAQKHFRSINLDYKVVSDPEEILKL